MWQLYGIAYRGHGRPAEQSVVGIGHKCWPLALGSRAGDTRASPTLPHSHTPLLISLPAHLAPISTTLTPVPFTYLMACKHLLPLLLTFHPHRTSHLTTLTLILLTPLLTSWPAHLDPPPPPHLSSSQKSPSYTSPIHTYHPSAYLMACASRTPSPIMPAAPAPPLLAASAIILSMGGMKGIRGGIPIPPMACIWERGGAWAGGRGGTLWGGGASGSRLNEAGLLESSSVMKRWRSRS